jgi:hypothetical protein
MATACAVITAKDVSSGTTGGATVAYFYRRADPGAQGARVPLICKKSLKLTVKLEKYLELTMNFNVKRPAPPLSQS